ncbi:adenylate/guanylate cyclase domain-containing protein [Mesorhizobium sp. M0663]|uniref:adenylate/guanylate cyclase domain-containing protein n=1 Tax=unclassified Mesorhizobium TaxID=325217 RepID=UPI0033351480
MNETLAAAISEVETVKGRGDLLLAYDLACEHLKTWPDCEQLKHAGLLALARAGATAHARRLFADWNLGASSNPHILALEARLAKDFALKMQGDGRRAGLLQAASIYQRIHERAPDSYLAINMASLAFLAGEHAQAANLAHSIIAESGGAGAADYWALASRAEANLLLGRKEEARVALVEAMQRPSNAGDRSSTRRQLKLIMAHAGASDNEIAAFLTPLEPPVTVHFLSNGLPGTGWTFSQLSETEMCRRIRQAVAGLRPGAAFGSVGTAAEIVFAEEILSFGAQLELAIPIRQSLLKKVIQANAGDPWATRFEACCSKAHRVVLPSDDPDATDTTQADYAVRFGMGLALLRAQHIDGVAVQVTLADAVRDHSSSHAAVWTSRGRERMKVQLDDLVKPQESAPTLDERLTHALIFGDVLGFSSLEERLLPVFWDKVMRVIGDVADEHRNNVELRNTWGDAVHMVLTDVRTAARISLAVQERLTAVDGRLFERETPPSMRIGAHYGPVFAGWDPVLHHSTFYGRALSKAARIEPIAPPGRVYVTEAFAAILLLETGQEFTCTYVGVVPLAKDFGFFRMYDLVGS